MIADASLNQAGVFERAKALENHFRRSGLYTYSLDVNQNRDRRLDPIEDFVRNHRTGHCEYFAGALTLMLRSQGIPARMVVGYKGGDFNAVGNYYIVRQLHAHAWVEAFLPNDEVPEDERDTPEPLVFGCWLSLDPTPDAVDMLEDTLHAPEASAGDDGDLGRRRRSHRLVDRWRWNLARLLSGRPARNKACGHHDEQNAQTQDEASAR